MLVPEVAVRDFQRMSRCDGMVSRSKDACPNGSWFKRNERLSDADGDGMLDK